MKQSRVTIKTVITHQVYVEVGDERFLYALTSDLEEAMKLKQAAKHEFGISKPRKPKGLSKHNPKN
jgi:hypothetical protein